MTSAKLKSEMSSSSTTSAMCQEFVQNAWKKDLCSNCFRLKVDHENGVERTQEFNNHKTSNDEGSGSTLENGTARSSLSSSSNNVDATNDANNSNNNNNSRYPFIKNGGSANWTSSPRKIGSNGAMLWEVGHSSKKDNEKNGAITSSKGRGSDSNGALSPHGIEPNKVQGILKENSGTTNGTNVLEHSIPIPKASAAAAAPPPPPPVSTERRGSVGFTEGSPKVIGYGGNDYEWEDQESSDELSDVDSLENFDLSEEEKAFTQLTDINTEFNADNSNLLNEALLSVAAAAMNTTLTTTQHHSSVVLAAKLTPINFYSMPSKVVSRLPVTSNSSCFESTDCETPPKPPLSPPPTSVPTSSSANAQEFIRSNLYSSSPVNTSDTDDFQDGETSEASTVVDKRGSPEEQLTLPAATSTRAGFQSVPVRKCSSSTSRASVQQLFKEEPVTACERQAAAENSLPIITNVQGPHNSVSPSNGGNSGLSSKPHTCFAYSVGKVCMENDGAPRIPSCPPPASNDESQKFPLQSNHTSPWTKLHANKDESLVQDSRTEPTAHVSSDNQSSSDGESPLKDRGGSSSGSKDREYAAVNHSCHYASSYVRAGSSMGHRPNDTSSPIPLPPTPLTNPYSSTSILKGVPPELKSPHKPLVTKPKPKLPAKPFLSPKHQGSVPTSPVKSDAPKSPEPSTPRHGIDTKATTNESHFTERNTSNGSRASVVYHEIPDDIGVEDRSEQRFSPATKDGGDVEDASASMSFESKVNSLANTLDFNRRITKRQAPKPPQGGSISTPETSPLSHQQQKQQLANSDPVVLRKHNKTYSPRSSSSSSNNKDSPINGSPSPSPIKTNFHCLAENRTSTSSLESYSSKASPSSINCQDFHHYKETKSKKSRFSLKKLLKFGKDDHHDDAKAHKGGKGEERRGKLEIIHPTDLLQSKSNNNNNNNNHRNERHDDMQTGNTSVSGADTTERSSPSTSNEQVDCQDMTDSSRWAANQETPPPSEALKASTEEDPNNDVKPPPPPRSRSSGEQQDTTKERPVRPPPPSQLSNAASASLSDDTWQKSMPRNEDGVHSETRNLDRDKRNSFYGSNMEYANLGDIRNSFAPKKPGRCTSSMIDISSNEELAKCPNLSTSQEILHNYACNGRQYGRGQSEDVTYYEPTAEETWQTDDIDDLYADQSAVTSSEPSQPSSFTSDSLSTSSTSTSKVVGSVEGETRQPWSRTAENLNGGSGGKVYERVILKKGNLEKVYAKLPIVSPSATESCSGSGSPSCVLADVDEGNEVGAGIVWPRRKSSRLSLRKAKSVVHKNLEDNYGAVVSANHQTLTQILEQVSMSQHTTTSKVKLLEDVPLHWSDFTLLEDSRVTVIGHMAFYSAIWQQNLEVTLMVTEECPSAALQSVRNPCALIPTAEFEDHIPGSLLSRHNVDTDDKLCRATIWVMERTRVETLDNVADSLHLQAETDMDGYEREVCFVLLQLINGLKHLQVLGIEEVDGCMDDFLLIMKNNDTNYRFVILSKGSEGSAMDGSSRKKLSLCQCALAVMLSLLHVSNPVQLLTSGDLRLNELKLLSSRYAFTLIGDILRQERATTLSQAKLLLEYMIWGPTDLSFDAQSSAVDCAGNDDEKAYQRWLDLERATVLNNLIRTQSLWQIRLTVFEEYMLSFLVRTCAKTLHEAAAQLQITHK